MAVCTQPGCPQTSDRAGYCPKHATQKDAQRSPTSDRVHRHLYNSARWKQLRMSILSSRMLCECDDHATVVGYRPFTEVVHHKQPHGGDERLFFDEANLQALAKVCHDAITGRSRARGDVER